MPRLGQKVAVRHRAIKNGTKVNMERSKDIEVRVITGVYMEPGKVRDSVGEVWEVVPNDESHQHVAEWKTVR